MHATSEQSFRQIFIDLKNKGKLCAPRGQKVVEIENYTYELPARVRFCNFEARKLKLDYIKHEFLWYLRGNRKDLSIMKHAKMWESLTDYDGGINSNYGQYIFSKNPVVIPSPIRTSFDFVVKQLTEDEDSRRASIPILGLQHLRIDVKDLPCTYSLNFRIRDNQLNMSVHMRSQDAVFGMGNDAPTFSFIHEMVWAALLPKYPDLQLGKYHHIADSFHVYERHFDVMEKIAEGDKYVAVDCPQIDGAKEVAHLKKVIHGLYPFDPIDYEGVWEFSIDPDVIDAVKHYQVTNFNFSTWLTTFEA